MGPDKRRSVYTEESGKREVAKSAEPVFDVEERQKHFVKNSRLAYFRGHRRDIGVQRLRVDAELRTLRTVLDGTGMRRSEVARLKIGVQTRAAQLFSGFQRLRNLQWD